MLDFAVLGLLAETPLHGYELRKRLSAVLGPFRVLSYGSLYPCLRRMQAQGLLSEQASGDDAPRRGGRRGRVVYTLTAEGKERFQELLEEAGPSSFDDEGFGVHFAFFGKTSSEVRLMVLEGRRQRLVERREAARAAASRRRERLDTWTSELQRHGLEAVDREVRWLSELIDTERATPPSASTAPTQTAATQAEPIAPGSIVGGPPAGDQTGGAR